MVRSHNLEPEKNMEYKTVTASNVGSLEKSVNEYLRHGWKPCGGVCAWSGGMMVMQAIVRG